jgi:hypothetical protein
MEDEQVNVFKNRIISDFNSNGIFENLKTQIRYKLLEKLSNQSEEPPKAPCNKLLLSLITEFLEMKNLSYSLAVFLPEW